MFYLSFIFSALLLTSPAKPKSSNQQFTLSGSIYEIQETNGGPAPKWPPDLIPIAKKKFVVVRWKGFDKKSSRFKVFKTDNKGAFRVQLPPGKYGIIALGDWPTKGQKLPKHRYNGDSENRELINWTASYTDPIEISDVNVTDVKLYKTVKSSCGRCP